MDDIMVSRGIDSSVARRRHLSFIQESATDCREAAVAICRLGSMTDNEQTYVNSQYAVYTRLGIPVVKTTGREFWGQAGVPFGVDEAPLGPSIAFDSTEGRWYASTINTDSDGIAQGTDLRIAVSRGDDPTEGFIGFKIHLHDATDATDAYGDSPVMGYNGSGFVPKFP